MHKMPKLLLVTAACVLLLASAVSAANVKELIEVYRNQITLKVNGKPASVDNFVFNGSPYLSLRAIAEQLGVEVAWDATTRVASVNSVKQLTLKGKVDPFKPVISLRDLGLRPEEIDAAKLELNGKQVFRRIEATGDQLAIFDDLVPAGSGVLELNKTYALKVYSTTGAVTKIDFATGGLPDITDKGIRQVIFVPAVPEMGFHWPYFLAVPGSEYKGANQGRKRYLMIDTTNTGTTSNMTELLARAKTVITQRQQFSMSLAEEMWLPMLYPVFPRPDVGYFSENEFNQFYTHALDRDTATLHVKMKNPNTAKSLTDSFKNSGWDVATFTNLDLQLNAMIDHAIEYLNQYGHKMEPKRVFLAGYSASGTFVDRYANLHPDRVKAVSSGATLDDMMLPMAQLKGKDLIFPIGTSDYKAITGRDFDLKKHNQIARLIFMGENDRNNVVPFSDCYGDKERNIITSLWGLEVLPRAKELTKLYGESGGKGMFILDRGIEHGMSLEMQNYLKTFFQANRDSETPIYPVPPNPAQLKYTLFK